MTATAHSIPPSETANASREVVRAALAELLAKGLRVAEAAARLAEVETQAADLLSAEATKAVQAVKAQDSVAEAVQIGQIADLAEATRDMAATRLALITATFERASRAVRRTAALMMRAEEARPFRVAFGVVPPGAAGSGEGRGPRAGEPSETLYERLDPPEIADEIGDRATHAVLADIRRDLRQAALVAGVRPAETPERPPGEVETPLARFNPRAVHDLVGPPDKGGGDAGIRAWPRTPPEDGRRSDG